MTTTMMKRWQVGYRFPVSEKDYTTPYVDLPEFDATTEQAYTAHANLQKNFHIGDGMRGVEWRLVEVRMNPTALLNRIQDLLAMRQDAPARPWWQDAGRL